MLVPAVWYSRVPLQRGLIHDITYSTLVTDAQHKSKFVFITDTPFLALTGELWAVYCEEFGENWSRYNGTTLYHHGRLQHHHGGQLGTHVNFLTHVWFGEFLPSV